MSELKRFWKLGIDLDAFLKKYDKEVETFLLRDTKTMAVQGF